VDNYGGEPRYEVDYLLYSLAHRCYLRLKVAVSEDHLVVDSVTSVWRGADWHEREAFDMFGIRFRGHPNLQRILMWDGYPYHPLRKDFPLAGLPAELPETTVDAGKVEAAPMLGGPFVTTSGARTSANREPRQADTAAERTERMQ
jgi:NADH-quinone oxidoreductase subunit C